MAERKVLTDKLVKALRPSDKRYDVLDAIVPGLLASVNPGGSVTLMLRTRVGSRTPIRRAIGQHGRVTVEQARRTAREWLELLHSGGSPEQARRKAREDERRARAQLEDNRFAAVFDKFCARKLATQRKGRSVEQLVRRELLPHWRERSVYDLDHRDVREAIERMVERGKLAAAHNLYDTCRALFKFALERDLIEHNPCDRVSRAGIIGHKHHRERTLSDAELWALWRATGRMRYPFGPAYRLLLLSGARLNEVAGAQ